MGAAVCFLWHMHQPFYRNPVGGEYRMPWTFLHATKDYYDMLRLAEQEGARVTFNLVPSLLDQLEDYAAPGVADTFLGPLRSDPGELSPEARADLLPRLFFAHREHQIRPLARYRELHDKAVALGTAAAQGLSRGEWLDLEVAFLLAWTGEVARHEVPSAAPLLARGGGYGQRDKERLLDELHALVGRTVDAYRQAQDEGRVELSTTPYYHPILPLLIRMDSARQALPSQPLPVVQRGFGSDAARQVDDAIERHRAAFGRPPAGFWPSEGSISAEALDLLADRGAEWAGSDEDVLAASLGRPLEGPGRSELYRPHRRRSPSGREIHVFFRYKELSDRIGFSYASWDAAAAVRDFVGRLEAVARRHGPSATIGVFLDGENAWEHYPANGAPFLRALYRAVAAHPDLAFATLSERRDGGPVLPRVHAGSWIYASFSTWVGHPEKNRAWELLERTRCRLEDEGGRLPDEARELAWREIRIAEGSDWFWWLGDDHYSPQAGEFDALFRLHLLNVYRLLGVEPPTELHRPIKSGQRRGLLARPSGPVAPRVDGEVSSYLEWLGSGRFDLGYDAGAMHRTDRRLRWLRYGCSPGRLHLCVEGEDLAGLRDRGLSLEVEAAGERELRVRFPLDGGAPAVVAGEADEAGLAFAWNRVGEVTLPLGAVGAGPGHPCYLALRLVRDGEVVERAPLYHMAELELPGEHALESWSA